MGGGDGHQHTAVCAGSGRKELWTLIPLLVRPILSPAAVIGACFLLEKLPLPQHLQDHALEHGFLDNYQHPDTRQASHPLEWVFFLCLYVFFLNPPSRKGMSKKKPIALSTIQTVSSQSFAVSLAGHRFLLSSYFDRLSHNDSRFVVDGAFPRVSSWCGLFQTIFLALFPCFPGCVGIPRRACPRRVGAFGDPDAGTGEESSTLAFPVMPPECWSGVISAKRNTAMSYPAHRQFPMSSAMFCSFWHAATQRAA